MDATRCLWAILLGFVLSFAACGARTELEVWGSGASGGGSGWSVEAFRQTAVTRVDLLLTLDNSISMADKQALLAEAVPLLVQRLITSGSVVDPVSDVHVGVITSSLGSHGANGPKDVCVSAEDDDHAHLLGQLRGLPGTWRDSGFLAWDPRHEQMPAGDADEEVFATKLRQQVQAAGEQGCGYEATLESWYRFLIDPEPPLAIVVTNGTSVPQGVDREILQQRAAFLRPDSLVAIIMLTDENDCSLRDDGQSWLALRAAPLFRSTSSCAQDPNDACCQTCGAVQPLPGCPAPAKDPECAKGTLTAQDDDLNLRCWQQKRRFGFDFMYPTSRYSEALRSPLIAATLSGTPLQNPLFAAPAGFLARDPSLIYLAGIIGVPWQDIADAQSLTGPGLRYMTASELLAEGRWDVILGDPEAHPPRPPSDPFMLETTVDRTGLAVSQQNPIARERLVSADSEDPHANAINGHEQRDVGQSDLQYACTFPLGAPRTCDQASLDAGRGCDCYDEDEIYNRPLCQPPGHGPADNLQRQAKAYPGGRHLQVLKDVGESAIVASICPKVLDKEAPDYGYNPAVEALINRVTNSVQRRCLPRALSLDDQGRVPCEVVQAFPASARGCHCEELGMMQPSDPTLGAAVQQKLQALGQCGSADPQCERLCRCQLPQFAGAELTACQNSPAISETSGFCYISATAGEPNVGAPVFVQDCPGPGRRDLRVMGGAPKSQLFTLLACPTP